MKNIIKKILGAILTVTMLFSTCSTVAAAEVDTQSKVVFSDISLLEAGERMEYTVISSDGGEAVIGIENIPVYTADDSAKWRIWYRGLSIYAEFYMTVTNNRVTSVSDYSISITGGSYENEELTKTTTYGKLTFKSKSIAGIVTKTCWLKGSVTGSDDKITVNWDM